MNEITERMFYEDKNVTVTQSRFVCFGKTHAMRNISSVSIGRIEGDKTISILVLGSGFIVMFFGNIGLIIGLGIVGLGIYLYSKVKDSFAVKISSNSGETKALVSKDRDYIITIVSALNDAIVYRG